MTLPTPRLGLVVHYGFVWTGPARQSPPDAGKDRPCVIVDLRRLVDVRVADRPIIRVTYLPISHVPPRGGEQALAIPAALARYLKLTSERSYAYVSYAVEDDWPLDLAHVPGSTDKFDYGFVPERFFSALAANFATHLLARPGFIHRR